MLLVKNSTPMVVFDSGLNVLCAKRERRLDLPTPESPMRTTTEKEGGEGEGNVRVEVRGREGGGEGEGGWR